MDPMTESLNAESLAFVEELYAQYLEDPSSVDPSWRTYFGGFREAPGPNGGRAGFGPSFEPSSIFDPPSEAVAPTGPPRPELAPVPSRGSVAAAERIPFLRSLRLLQGVSAGEVEELAKLSTEFEASDGEHIFRQGDAADALYIVLEGSVIILRDGEITIELGPGEVVGELAVLDQAPRIADAIAHGTVRLLRLGARDLIHRLDQSPALARGVIRGLTRRLRVRGTQQHRVDQLVRAYRIRGHLRADLNPLAKPQIRVPELELEHWGLSEKNLDTLFASGTIPGTFLLKLREIVDRMQESYCGSIGLQYMHLNSLERKRWLQRRLEDPSARRKLTVEEQRRILTKLTDAEIFEQFVHKKFLGAKRFSAEGAETLVPLLDLVVDEAAAKGCREIVFGMAHRGRLNVLANIMGKSPAEIFAEFQDQNSDHLRGRGDVKYHMGYSTDRLYENGNKIHLSLCFNPSHLEFVGPVAMGRVRAKQQRAGDTERRQGIAVVIHGDAAFSGQGVVQEMLNMSELDGYTTGGTIHLVINNQVGFTTPPESGRSSHYATDVAKLLETPIFHVNGEHPEAVAHVVRMAVDYRAEFSSDVIIDMYCYRRYGHNEGDEPAFTQPLMYQQIRQRKSVREGYLDSLLPLGGINAEEAARIVAERSKALEDELERTRRPEFKRSLQSLTGSWSSFQGGRDEEVSAAETAVPVESLRRLLRAQISVPGGFNVHRKLRKGVLQARRAMAEGERPLDWGGGEALAFASLLTGGHPVRLTGQDCGRGTFSHRHAVLHDAETGGVYVPLNHIEAGQAEFQVWDSPLSEVGPLGFEFGYSLDSPESLVLWEAQFGDFCNVAQVIIDQFISSSEDKWNRLSALCLLLPHGFEGQGPEHSSARLERFLTLCAEDNMQVVNLTTPAQLFHCLRRQVLRPLRKPLIVMSPKSLLRHPQAISSLEDLAEGGFRRVLPDPEVKAPKAVRRVLLCSGKIYYDLVAARAEREAQDVAIVRLEQYYPWSEAPLLEALEPFPGGTEVVWVQEEPWNMGARSFVEERLGGDFAGRWPVRYLSRPVSASPATGSGAAHRKEQEELVASALAP